MNNLPSKYYEHGMAQVGAHQQLCIVLASDLCTLMLFSKGILHRCPVRRANAVNEMKAVAFYAHQVVCKPNLHGVALAIARAKGDLGVSLR